MKIRSNLNYKPSQDKPYHETGEVLTQPDDCLSMREIYNRFRNGEPLDVNLYEPFYSDDEYQDIDVSVLDPVEVLELNSHYNEIRRKHEQRLEAEEQFKKYQEDFKKRSEAVNKESSSSATEDK